MAKKIRTIYVSLLDEGHDTWRPVKANHAEKDLFKIISKNEDPEDEIWEFQIGDIVRCKEKKLSGAKGPAIYLVAFEKVKN